MAQEITKDNYDFGFVTVPVNYKEEQLEAALEQNITCFLLELDTGFAFVGRQKELIVGNRSRKMQENSITMSTPLTSCSKGRMIIRRLDCLYAAIKMKQMYVGRSKEYRLRWA